MKWLFPVRLPENETQKMKGKQGFEEPPLKSDFNAMNTECYAKEKNDLAEACMKMSICNEMKLSFRHYCE